MKPKAPEQSGASVSPANSTASVATRVGIARLLHDPNIPPVIPDYEVLKRIGGGSYGDVWLARSMLGTWRAVKAVYRNSFEHDKPFERQVPSMLRASHTSP